MFLYLIRHGIAVERESAQNDAKRPLTAKGREKTARVARSYRDKGLSFELILTSPLTRAVQTAEILQQAGLCQQITIFPALSPQGELREWVNWYLTENYNRRESNLALVGHQPDLGNWTEILVWGETRSKLILKKAGTIGIKLPPNNDDPIAKGELFLLTAPKWLL